MCIGKTKYHGVQGHTSPRLLVFQFYVQTTPNGSNFRIELNCKLNPATSIMRVFKGFFRSWNSLCLSGGRVCCCVEDVKFYRIGNENARGELLLAVGTKLDHVISQMSREDAEKNTMPTNFDLIVHPSADYPSFHRPRLVSLCDFNSATLLNWHLHR
ncbi:hypothetical protein ACFX2I_005819 [Malus domestica]|uniref:Uncharacterized protein n=1 Tax=Malus domestica TaxID=3750 RepID=A0A498INS9_MALDO|nr:hypothetical protein DVH24_041784 [Malus domestica]